MITKSKAAFHKILIGLSAAGIIIIYYFFDARLVPFPRCPFYLLTHIYCPGCGSQRALSALLHGQVAAAMRYNLLLVLFLPLLLYAAWVKLRPAGLSYGRLFYKPVFVRLVLISVLLFWLMRNIPYYPFSLLAPVE